MTNACDAYTSCVVTKIDADSDACSCFCFCFCFGYVDACSRSDFCSFVECFRSDSCGDVCYRFVSVAFSSCYGCGSDCGFSMNSYGRSVSAWETSCAGETNSENAAANM